MTIIRRDEPIQLLAGHAAFLPGHSTLVLSDVHLGKAAAFQSKGIAIPEGDDLRDLQRIATLIRETGAQHLVIAGDLFHSAAGRTPQLDEQLAQWTAQLPATATLVLGNHDRKSLTAKTIPGIPCVPHLDLGEILITHDPAHAPEAGRFTIAGHLHPAIRIRQGKASAIRCPCFWSSGHMLVLPSFGTFTGGRLIHPGPEDSIHIALNGRIVEIPASLRMK